MADIDVQEKKSGAVWPWLLGALALVLVVWAVAGVIRGDDEDFIATTAEELVVDRAPAPVAMERPTEVAQFEQQCGTPGAAQDDMGMAHEYTNNCIRSMTAALNAVIMRAQVDGTDLSDQFAMYREKADNLTQEPGSTEHAATVDNVFDDAASLARSVEESRAGTGAALSAQTDAVQQAADAVNASDPLLDQQTTVGNFFRSMAAALNSLSM
ncbi:hypothetical protein BH23GEM10_BH23GEM10_14710 [soil metagenome]